MTSPPGFYADTEAKSDGLDFTRLLSQRDASIKIPINYVPVPGVSLTAACFPHGQYAIEAGSRCFSNLLAVGFRRFEVDLFWDPGRGVWSLCPAELSDEAAAGGNIDRTTATIRTQSVTATLASGQLSDQTAVSAPSTAAAFALLQARQTIASSSERIADSISPSATSATGFSSVTSLNSGTQTASGSATTQSVTSATNQDEHLTRVGDYACSPDLTFNALLSVLNRHLENTEDNLNATTKYLYLNLYLAQPTENANGSSTISSDNQPESLGDLIASNNSQFLYTPENLRNQRANLLAAGSWFQVATQYVPTRGYFDVDTSDAVASSVDGWPSESFVELANAKRFLSTIGRVDSDLTEYNYTSDASTLFPERYTGEVRQNTISSAGELRQGCFFNSRYNALESANSSWSVTTVGDPSRIDRSSIDALLTSASQLVACGISPILNTTLLNKTADQDYAPYKAYVQSTIWSWATDEPRNTSKTKDGEFGRCAVLNVSSSRWRTDDCSNTHHAACRIRNLPYQYSISDDSVSYERAEEACPKNTSFTVPRTGLENQYLHSVFKTYRDGQGSAIDDPADELLWIDFNDLSAESCWVVGANTTCPYQAQDRGSGRTIVVPTVAAVIVLVIALAVIVIKVAANRRTTRRKTRRGDDGWDYEGVPS
ncbi:hypothetical protein B0A48_11790 [Cryoendolithus antarcticus]|uniref:Maintenance of telomere capping protein 6 n=1 Tax=Cryoendolithus antarcticus TaxID=1507870 RepID=A0A1V8SSW2_9PEZI|nr:hypothetical protein B0A48_11790 [Cryoendolithus antarcticus]